MGKDTGISRGLRVWPKSWDECVAWNKSSRWTLATQSTHSAELELRIAASARSYLFVWLLRPTASVSQTPTRADLIDPKLLQRWRSVAIR